ncbi:MAG TPA: hypothetical protein VKV95_14480 [Terriglobia bacterium]|nr:hypothetical protein [Terriglobia bacterium]
MPDLNSRTRGYAFLVLMMMVTILLVTLTAALPSIYTEGQREKEEELIFRGNEYARAILFFHNKFGRYPNSVDELVKKTNGVRFLRQAYSDPMSPQGQWRFIHANAAGMVIDSKTMTLPTATANQNGLNPPGQQNSANVPPGASSILEKNPGDLQNGVTPAPGTTDNSGLNPSDQQDSETAPTSQDSASTPGETNKGSSFTSSDQTHGLFIVGVASTSKKSSFRVYNNHNQYDEWEFLAVGQGVAGLLAPGGTTGTQTTPTNQANPGQNPGQAPSGTGPTSGQGIGPGAPAPPDTPQ